MIEDPGIILLTFSQARFACAGGVTAKEADIRSGSDRGGKQRGEHKQI